MFVCTEKSINWITFLKALCIIFVFLRHCENYYGLRLGWFDGIYLPFYVNAFFFVSGYLLFWKQLSEPKILEDRRRYLTKSGSGRTLFLNILFRIIIPSIIFATIEFIPKKLIRGQQLDFSSFCIETIGGCTYWFTSALVIAELLLLILFITRKKNIWFYFIAAIFFATVGVYLSRMNVCLVPDHSAFPWEYKQGLIATIFLAFGGLYYKYENVVRRVLKKWVIVILTIAYCYISIKFKGFLYNGYMTSMCLTHVPGVLWGVISSILLIEFCRLIPENKVLTFIGQNSIGFYFMSGALPIMISMVAHYVIEGYHYVILFVDLFVCLAVAYLVVMLIVKWLPWLFDLRLLRSKVDKS